jgi:hypothetical protein
MFSSKKRIASVRSLSRFFGISRQIKYKWQMMREGAHHGV